MLLKIELLEKYSQHVLRVPFFGNDFWSCCCCRHFTSAGEEDKATSSLNTLAMGKTHRRQGFNTYQIKHKPAPSPHSGHDHHSGVTTRSSKAGKGKFNWGNVQDEIAQGKEQYYGCNSDDEMLV